MFGCGGAVKPGSANIESCPVFIIDCQGEDDKIERLLPSGTSGDEKTIKLLHSTANIWPQLA